jgi:hypothetical protein
MKHINKEQEEYLKREASGYIFSLCEADNLEVFNNIEKLEGGDLESYYDIEDDVYLSSDYEHLDIHDAKNEMLQLYYFLRSVYLTTRRLEQ